MAAIHDKVQFGFMGQPKKLSAGYVRTTFMRAISSVSGGGSTVTRPAGVGVASNIFLRRANSLHSRLTRLTMAAAYLPIFFDSVDIGGSANIPPVFLGSTDALVKRPRLWMARTYMNVKFGAKTRPC